MTAKSSDDRLFALAKKIKGSYTPAEIARLILLIEPTPSTGEMSSDEFENMMNYLDATSTRRGYSEKSREAARLIFVMGANEQEAAADTGLSQQTINQLKHRIRRRMESMPAGWVSVTTWLPEDVAKRVKFMSGELLSAHKSGVPSDSVAYKVLLGKS